MESIDFKNIGIMKKTLQSLSLLALTAAALIGCSKDDVQSAATATKEVSLTLTAEKPEIDDTPEARTVYSDGHILWNTTGEKLRIAYADNGIIAAKATFQIANATEVSADQKTAKFQFKGTVPAQAGAYTLHALYPSAASTYSTLDYQESATSKIKNPQSPLAESFDPEADVMVGTSVKSYALFPENEDIAMTYKRLVAHGQVTLTGLPFEAGETVDNVTFTAPEGTKVAGTIRTDLLKKEISYTANADNYVSLSYTDAPLDADGNFVAWFCSIPFTVEADQTLKIEVSTARGTYTRTITARAGGISFKENARNLLTVNMTNAEFTPVAGTELPSGQYVIAVKVDDVYHAMTSTITSSRRGTQEIVYADPYLTDNETLVWTVTKTGANTYTIKNGDSYLSNNTTSATAPTSTTAVNLVFNPNEDGMTYRIPNQTGDRSLARNGTNGFAFYIPSGSYASDLYFIPAEIKMVPSITVADAALSLASDDEALHSIEVSFKNATADDIVCAAYEGEAGETAAAWFAAEFKAKKDGNGVVEILAEANTSEEPRKGRIILIATTAEGTATATIAVEQSGQGAQIVVYEKVESAPANGDWSGEYLITSGSYVCPAYTSGNNIQGQTITIDKDGKIASNATTDACKMIFTKITEGTYTGMYTIQDSNGLYLYAAGTASSGNYLKGQVNLVAGSYWDITLTGTTLSITASKATAKSKDLKFNASNNPPIFACYSSGQTAVVLYKNPQSVGGDTPDPTLPELPQPVIESDGIDVAGNEVTLMWEADPDAKDYTVSFSPETLTPQTATADGGMVLETYTLAYDTTYTISIVANPADPTSHNVSQPTVLTVTTGEDPSPKITGITWNFDGETTTSNSPIIEFPIEGGDAEVTVTTHNKGSNAIGFSTISNFDILEDGSESFYITAADNTDGEAKEEKLTLTLGTSTFEITIKQAGQVAATTTHTATYTVATKTSVTTSNTAPDGSTAAYTQTYSTAGQMTANNSTTLTLSGYSGCKITGLTLSMKSNKSAGAGSMTATAGTTKFASIAAGAFNTANWNGAYSQDYVNITPEVTSYTVQDNETITIVINATANSLYIESYSITYEK